MWSIYTFISVVSSTVILANDSEKLNCCWSYMIMGRWANSTPTNLHSQECSITLETEAYFICSQIKATEVKPVEKMIPSKQGEKKTLSSPINNMKTVLFIKTASGLIGTHRSLVCCKLSYYITLTWAKQRVQAHSVYSGLWISCTVWFCFYSPGLQCSKWGMEPEFLIGLRKP